MESKDKAEFIEKWRTWWMLTKSGKELTEAFKRELNNLIENEGAIKEESEIMILLKGDTPKQKYEYLIDLITESVANENGEIMFISVSNHEDLMADYRGRILDGIAPMVKDESNFESVINSVHQKIVGYNEGIKESIEIIKKLK